MRSPRTVPRLVAAGCAVSAYAALASAVSAPPTQLATTLADFELPGSQPGDLTDLINASDSCSGCHGYYDETTEPYRLWAASMMGQASRDPVFHATLAIANQDADFGGDLCLRCHTPGAWLAGRSVPTDGSGLDQAAGDFDGVTCHFCHRLVDPVLDAENPAEDAGILAGLASPPPAEHHSGMYVVDPEDRRRGPFDLGSSFFYHPWLESPYHRESLLCATCHDVSNPLLERQPDGTWQLNALNAPPPSAERDDMFPVERTYSEWAHSVFAEAEVDMAGRFGGQKPNVGSCQDCHMPDLRGTACAPGLGEIREDMPLHTFAGSNSWVLRAIRSLYPDWETGLSDTTVDAAIARNVALLRAAADVEAVAEVGALHVRVTNMGGHKLPTGYGEGRRMWLNLRFFDGADRLVAERGAYDSLTADLSTSDTTVFEVVHGIDAQMSAATGQPVGPSFHFLLNNTTEKDNRIPARGFREAEYAAVGAKVVGTSYDDEQYWSESSFDVPAGAVRAEVRLFHQTTSKEYITFLRDENTTNNAGADAYALWQAFGMSTPVEMALVDVDLAASGCLAPRPLALGKDRAGGGRPTLAWSGSPSATAGNFALEVEGGAPDQLAVVFVGDGQVSRDHFGGVLNAGPVARREVTLRLDANGAATVPIALSPADVGGVRTYQVLFRDPGDPIGLGMTGGLRVDVCP